MVLGIMQPYIFPYVGYFQLLNSVDKFIIYNDVSYIKQGWINRNRILLNNKDYLFTVPVKNSSSFKLINETEINADLYTAWFKKFRKTIDSAYAKAPYYLDICPMIDNVFNRHYNVIDELCYASIMEVIKYINIDTNIVRSSQIYNNDVLKSSQRILDICRQESADTYINAIGGESLYSKAEFESYGVKLGFIKPEKIIYRQYDKNFVPWLSMIDVMMFNPRDAIKKMLDKFEIV